MAIERKWDIQTDSNWWLSLGFHIDHTDPSVTLHLPGFIVSFGRCKQPGFTHSLYRFLNPPVETLLTPQEQMIHRLQCYIRAQLGDDVEVQYQFAAPHEAFVWLDGAFVSDEPIEVVFKNGRFQKEARVTKLFPEYVFYIGGHGTAVNGIGEVVEMSGDSLVFHNPLHNLTAESPWNRRLSDE